MLWRIVLYRLYLRYVAWKTNRQIVKIKSIVAECEAAILRLEELGPKDDYILRLKTQLETMVVKLRNALVQLETFHTSLELKRRLV